MERLEEMTVGEIMETEVVTVGPRDPVRTLVRRLADQDVSGVPVVDEDGVAVGVVSATDVIRLAAQAGETEEAAGGRSGGRDRAAEEGAETGDEGESGPPGARGHGYFRIPDGPLLHYPVSLPAMTTAAKLETTPVRDIMMPATFSVRRETTVSELARFLLRGEIHRALVLEGGRLVGIVTTFDVLRAVAGERRETRAAARG